MVTSDLNLVCQAPELSLLTMTVIFKEERLEGTLKEGVVPDREAEPETG